jgi:hypothetical protein
MCGHCNQKYKSQEDTLFELDAANNLRRRKVFYPYDTSLNFDAISVSIDDSAKKGLKNSSWKIKLNGPLIYREQIESWEKIFDIKDRYKNRIKSKYAKTWYEPMINLYKKKKVKTGFNFNDFKTEIYDGIRPFHLQESSILERAYYDFFFSDVDCEKNLNAITT